MGKQVNGKLSRKSLAIITEATMGLERGKSIVFGFQNQAGIYEIRGTRLSSRRIELTWGDEGSFFRPGGYDNK